ncbi:MAG: bifunctional phosphoribosyl-AMP cyclohydrolase/phosphoribosyl-ATP diphosphatase HisIE [Thermoanaerobaculia bacterium]|nr:bifunctional phosphoribosyl-AMP cyclohydrolase/phosphoribosyl-ATP diphosphatase HisIE [Thermoanaerobaculia bacterium]
MKAPDPAGLDFEKGLVAAVVRDEETRDLLMVAWMNREAYEKTIDSGETWFWSRSREELWHKGETSGNRQRVSRIAADCDGDALIIDVRPMGPACHTGERSCFGDEKSPARLDLERLESVMKSRKVERPEGSYTASLFEAGTDEILRKIGEESIEVILAAKSEGATRIVEESADLIVHLTALLVNEGIDLAEVANEMRRRER